MSRSVYPTFAYNPKLGRRARALELQSSPNSHVCFCSSVEEGLQGLRKLELNPTEKRALTKAEKEVESLIHSWNQTEGLSVFLSETDEIQAQETLVSKGWTLSKGCWQRALPNGSFLSLQRYRSWSTLGWRLQLQANSKIIMLAESGEEGLRSAVKLLSDFEDLFRFV